MFVISLKKDVFNKVHGFPLFGELYENILYYGECESIVNGNGSVSLVIPEHMSLEAMKVITELREHGIKFDAYNGSERIEASGKTGAIVMGENGFVPRALLSTRQKLYLITALAEKLREVGGEDAVFEAGENAMQDMEDANISADETAVNNLCGL